MIAKRITTKAAAPRVARLVKYVVAAQGGIDPRSWSRTADYMLNSGTSNRGEKVGGVRVTNCNTSDPAAATTLIECTQAANTRSKTDKTYHLVFSFPPGEEPDLKILNAIEDQLCAAIGYADHQRISAVHIDTDHLHVHVAINKVHPTGYQNIEPYFDKKKLMEACERLEIEFGLTRTNHGLHGETPKAMVRNKQAEAEAHSGIETLAGFVSREVLSLLKDAKDWNQAHSILAKHGLIIKKRGAGLVIGNESIWVRASQCDRSLSLKAMEGKLGPFETNQQKPAEPYQPKPQQRHPSSAALFEQYQRQQMKHKAVRNYGVEQVKYEGALMEANLQRWRIAQKRLVKLAAKGPTRRAMLKMVKLHTDATRKRNWQSLEPKRRKVIADTAFPTWAQWLAQQTENGNSEALAVLRSRKENDAMRGDTLTAKHQTTEHVILNEFKPHADGNGTLSYNTADGGVVIDRKTHVQSFRTTAGASLMALEIAAKRFKGQALIVEGSEEFKKDVTRLAKMHKINVRITQPVIHQQKEAEL